MANLAFKKGTLKNLPAALTEGTFYVTTDERGLYLDVSGTERIRFGDFQEVETLEALNAINNPSQTALYYVKSMNCLAKFNGTEFIQINLDTGATKFETTGSGNAVTGISYDPTTRTVTVTKGATYTTAGDVDTAIATKVGTLTLDGTTYDTVKAYVDKKTEGIATDAALGDITARVTTAEGKITTAEGEIDTLQSDVTGINDTIGEVPTGKTVVQLIADAKSEATYDDTALAGRVTAVEGDVNTLKGTAETEGSVAYQIAQAVAKIMDNPDETVNSIKELVDWTTAHATDAVALTNAVEALQNKLAGIDSTVAAYVTSAINALNIGDYAKAADLTAAITRIATLEGKAHTHANATVLDGITATKVSAWDAAEQNAKDYADEIVGNISTDIVWGEF